MVLHRQIVFSLANAAIAEAILMRTSVEQAPSVHRVVPRYLKRVTSCNFWPCLLMSAQICSCTVVVFVFVFWFGCLFLFLCADFDSICRCSIYECVGEVLKVTTVAALKIDVVGKSYAAYVPSTSGDGC